MRLSQRRAEIANELRNRDIDPARFYGKRVSWEEALKRFSLSEEKLGQAISSHQLFPCYDYHTDATYFCALELAALCFLSQEKSWSIDPHSIRF